MQLNLVIFQVLYEHFLVVRILSTFSMLFHVPIRTEKCNKTFSCNLFGVILHNLLTLLGGTAVPISSKYRNIRFGYRHYICM